MNIKLFPKILFLPAALAAVFSLHAEVKKIEDYTVSMKVDRADGLYKIGEESTFTMLVTKDGRPVPGIEAGWSVSKDGVAPFVNGTATTDAEGRARFKGVLDEPGFVRCTAQFELPGVRSTRNIQAGAGYEPLKIPPSRPMPDDFAAYWERQKEILAAIPMNIVITPLESRDPAVLLFDVQADAFKGRMSGCLAYPKGAADRSLPAIVTCHGAGVRSSYGNKSGPNAHAAWSPGKWAAMGFIALDFNALGLPNFKERSYYDELQKTTHAQYWLRSPESRDTIFFRELYMRLMRAMDVVMAQPQWDGRILVVGGRSQGGGQAIAAAALNDKVTFFFAHIAALCDQTGMLAGRANGWPRDLAAVKMTSREKMQFKNSLPEHPKPGIDDGGVDALNQARWLMPVIEAARYVDAMNFAALARGDAFFSVGFCDKICPPTTVYAAYNNVPGKNKTMLNCIDIGHVSDSGADAAAEAAVMAHVKKMRGE
jgi:cephalosporin-C deacetylase-like acetyl esterase